MSTIFFTVPRAHSASSHCVNLYWTNRCLGAMSTAIRRWTFTLSIMIPNLTPAAGICHTLSITSLKTSLSTHMHTILCPTSVRMSDDSDGHLDTTAVANLKAYLAFPTVHPDPDYRPAVEWLLSQGEALGLSCYTEELVPDNPVVVMRWPGSRLELKGILLNSHMDVVPVEADRWSHPPFSAVQSEGKIYARGAQDMKSIGIQQLEAIRRLKARGISCLPRTVYLTFVPDEELGGTRGMRPFVQGIDKPTEATGVDPGDVGFAKLNVAVYLDEGLPSPTDSYLAFYDERRPFWCIVHFDGTTGHALNLFDNTAGEKFNIFLDRIMKFRASEKRRLTESQGQLHLGDVTTVNLTIVRGGVQHNVLPGRLSAYFDVRLPPSVRTEDWIQKMEDWAAQANGGVTFEYVQGGDLRVCEPALNPNHTESPWWSALVNTCQKHGISVEKQVFPGATDARYVREYHLRKPQANLEPILAIGFSPIRRTPVLLHDHDEYIQVEGFLEGCRVYADLLLEMGSLVE